MRKKEINLFVLPLGLWMVLAWAMRAGLSIFGKPSFAGTLLCALIAAIPAAGLAVKNCWDYYVRHDKLVADPMAKLKGNDVTDWQSIQKRKALYPPIPQRLKSREPEGMILGKAGIDYIRKPAEDDGHLMIIGGTGSGKSSCLAIPILLARSNKTSIFCLDIKGELHEKTCSPNDPAVRIISPTMPGAWSYDPFYRIKRSAADPQIMSEDLRQIAATLIPLPHGTDPFWAKEARRMLLGLMAYYYTSGIVDFVEVCDKILTDDIKTQITKITKQADHASLAYRELSEYKDMSEKTLPGIATEVKTALELFSTDADIRQMLSCAGGQVTDPTVLNDGQHIFLHVPEDRLSIYSNFVILIINQMLLEMTRRPEDSKPVIFMVDELARILSANKIPALIDGAATLRSRKVSLVLITQSLEALEISYSPAEVEALTNNMPYIAVLSSASSKTAKAICERAGTFKDWRKSYMQINNAGDRKTYSYDYRNILEPGDLADLKERGEVVIVSQDYGYFRARKCPYYKDRALSLMQKTRLEEFH